MSKQLDYSKISKNTFSVEEHVYKYLNLGTTIGFDV